MSPTSQRRRRRRVEWADLEPIGVGYELRVARERLGLTIEEVAEETRIRPSSLVALEEEHFSALPEGVAGRGLLRAYATYLGLDAIELLSALEAQGRLSLGPASIEREARRSVLPRSQAHRVLGLVVALLCVIGLAYYVYSQYAAFVAAEAAGGPRATAVRGAVLPFTATPEPTATSTPQPTASPTAILAAAPVASPTPQPPTPTATAVLPTSTPFPTPTPRLEVVVEARISADTRARVEIDGKLHYEGLLAARDQRTWRGSTVTLQAENAGAIEIILNGRTIGKLGTLGQPKTVTWSR